MALRSPALLHLSIPRDGSGAWLICHTGVANSTYRLQRATSVSGPWSDFATNVMPPSILSKFHEANLPPASLYRAVQP